MIDHTRAFRLSKDCPRLKDVSKIERNLLERLRALTYNMLRERMGEYVTEPEIKGVLARRDLIVKEFESRIQRLGEAAVVFEMAEKASPSGNLNLQASN